MKIDFFKLNNLNKLDIDSDFSFDPSYYENMDIIDIKDLHVSGQLRIDYEDIVANLIVKGTFILSCAISLESVPYEFEIEIDDSLGTFDDFYKINKNVIDILPFLWGYVVSEVPIKVVKEGINIEDFNSGNGWELISEEE